MNRIPNAAGTATSREGLAVAGVFCLGLFGAAIADAALWALEQLPCAVAALAGQAAWAAGVIADMLASLPWAM